MQLHEQADSDNLIHGRRACTIIYSSACGCTGIHYTRSLLHLDLHIHIPLLLSGGGNQTTLHHSYQLDAS